MKILINSAYGYMGAGSMALFADSRAADEVTRRGRETLDMVLAALRERGIALIEADTDGVYFAVPEDWAVEQEEALVAEVGALLTSGIRLEYEGRYQAMFSHEVKNYALLTYRNELIVRGVALRSSRAEPFGVRFLLQALPMLMRNDIVALRQCYLAVVESLRTRQIPARDLGSKVRLSKSPQAYQASRQNHPEAQYEALLNAGRTNWYPGEQVRFYRARGKYVWLPDESDELPQERDWQPSTSSDGSATVVAASLPKASPAEIANRRDYDVDHYIQLLVNSYAARLRKAFVPEDFAQLFRLDGLSGLFDKPIEEIQPRWIRC
jgi:DNA polymerase elongation subunit (family B)